MGVEKLIEGHKTFKQSSYQTLQQDFETLTTEGQKPGVLLIGCVDSRVNPWLVFNTKPGDFLVIRNVGNFVPPHDTKPINLEMASALEFAVNVLQVQDIVVCGHSQCGACKALHHPPNMDYTQHLLDWLEQNAHTRALSIAAQQKNPDNDLYVSTEKISLLNQIENLKTYPFITEKVGNNSLGLHAWYYNIREGNVERYDFQKMAFATLGE